MILFFSFFSWYFSFSFSALQHIFSSTPETFPMINASFNFTTVITLVLSSFFIHKFNKMHIIYGYAIITPIASLILLLSSSLVLKLIIVFAAAILFGISQLASLKYFWSLTTSIERGRTAGLAGIFTLPLAYITGWLAETSNFSGTIIICIILNLITLTIILFNPENKPTLTKKKDERGHHPEKRTILLYAIPWILFSIINITLARNISIHVSQNIQSTFYMILLVLQMIASGFGALAGGIVADLFGRRFPIGFSLTLYGISTALGAFTQNHEVLYFIYIANGLTWGIFWTMYIPVIWGDLTNKENNIKTYAFGLLIYYLSTGIGILLSNQISQIPIMTSALLGCILIFLSNIPIILAPELLSQDFRDSIKLKLYMNILRKKRKKPLS